MDLGAAEAEPVEPPPVPFVDHLSIPTKMPMEIANARFIPAVRTTLCDIICTVSTSIHFGVPKPPDKLRPLMASLPYKGTTTLTSKIKNPTRFQTYSVSESRRQVIDALHKEHDAFMGQLMAEKDEVDFLRNKATTKIQALYRGYKARPGPSTYEPKKKPKHIYSQNQMQDDLCRMASKLNLKPINGLSLEARSKASKRQERIFHAAAFRLQNFFAMICAKREAQRRVLQKWEEKLDISARRITRAVRYVKVKKFVHECNKVKQEQMSLKIACRTRIFLARERVRFMRKQKQDRIRQNESAIIIQRNLAPKYRELDFARVSILTMRHFNWLVAHVVDDTAELLLNEGISQAVDFYGHQLSELLDTAAERALDKCINVEIFDAVGVESKRWLEEQMSRILAEHQRLSEERSNLDSSLDKLSSELGGSVEDEWASSRAILDAASSDPVSRTASQDQQQPKPKLSVSIEPEASGADDGYADEIFEGESRPSTADPANELSEKSQHQPKDLAALSPARVGRGYTAKKQLSFQEELAALAAAAAAPLLTPPGTPSQPRTRAGSAIENACDSGSGSTPGTPSGRQSNRAAAAVMILTAPDEEDEQLKGSSSQRLSGDTAGDSEGEPGVTEESVQLTDAPTDVADPTEAAEFSLEAFLSDLVKDILDEAITRVVLQSSFTQQASDHSNEGTAGEDEEVDLDEDERSVALIEATLEEIQQKLIGELSEDITAASIRAAVDKFLPAGQKPEQGNAAPLSPLSADGNKEDAEEGEGNPVGDTAVALAATAIAAALAKVLADIDPTAASIEAGVIPPTAAQVPAREEGSEKAADEAEGEEKSTREYGDDDGGDREDEEEEEEEEDAHKDDDSAAVPEEWEISRDFVSVQLLRKEKREIETLLMEAQKLYNMAAYEEAIATLDSFDAVLEKFPTTDTNHPDVARLLSTVTLLKARSLFARGMYMEAKQLFDTVSTHRAEVFSKTHFLCAEVYYFQGEWHRAVAQYDEADRLLAQAATITEAIINALGQNGEPQQSDTKLWNLSNRVGIAQTELARQRGQYFKANSTLQKVQERMKLCYSKNIANTDIQGDFVCATASMLATRGKISEALQLHLELLEHRRQVYGSKLMEDQSIRIIAQSRKLSGAGAAAGASTKAPKREEDPVDEVGFDSLSDNAEKTGDSSTSEVNHPKIASSMISVGVLKLLRCEFTDAADMIEQSLSMRRALYPSDHPAVAQALFVKAETFAALGRYREAVTDMKAALHLRRAKFGVNHPAVARSMLGLARIQTEMGEPLRAWKGLTGALQIFRTCFATDKHREVAACAFSMGRNAECRESFVEAIAYHEQALQLRQALLPILGISEPGDIHLDVETSKVHLARVFGFISRFEQAKPLMKLAVKRMTRVLGNNNVLVARSLSFLGELCKLRGNFSDAKTLFGLAFNINEQLFGSDHPDVATLMMMSADNLRMPGYYKEASELALSAFGIRSYIFGADSLHTAVAMFHRALILRDSGEHAAARQMLIAAQEIVLTKAGEPSGVYANIIAELGECYRLEGTLDEAEKCFNSAVDVQKSMYGDDAVVVHDTLLNFTLLLLDRRHPDEASQILRQKIVPQYESLLGGQHPKTLYAKANLALAGQLVRYVNSPTPEDAALVLNDILAHKDILEFQKVCREGEFFTAEHPWLQRFVEGSHSEAMSTWHGGSSQGGSLGTTGTEVTSHGGASGGTSSSKAHSTDSKMLPSLEATPRQADSTAQSVHSAASSASYGASVESGASHGSHSYASNSHSHTHDDASHTVGTHSHDGDMTAETEGRDYGDDHSHEDGKSRNGDSLSVLTDPAALIRADEDRDREREAGEAGSIEGGGEGASSFDRQSAPTSSISRGHSRAPDSVTSRSRSATYEDDDDYSLDDSYSHSYTQSYSQYSQSQSQSLLSPRSYRSGISHPLKPTTPLSRGRLANYEESSIDSGSYVDDDYSSRGGGGHSSERGRGRGRGVDSRADTRDGDTLSVEYFNGSLSIEEEHSVSSEGSRSMHSLYK